MAMNTLEEVFLQKCEIYYGDALISKEEILSEYAKFFSNALANKEHSVSFALHTGSVCFDFIAVVVAALGCLTHNLTSNDDIIAGLKEGDIVIYGNKRYRWISGQYEIDGNFYLALEQDGTGKNGNPRTYIPQKNKYLIKPYYGTAQTTDGRGVKRRKTGREDFLSRVFAISIEEVPSVMEIAVVIIANRNDFYDIYKNIRIVYAGNKQVKLLDIVPAAYYTSGGEEYQYGANPTKSEPVLKVVGRITTARELLLDRNANRVAGLLVTQIDSLTENGSELADLLRRKSLRFIHVAAPIKNETGEHILDMYDDAEIFACTKNYLVNNSGVIRSENPYTLELQRQVFNIVNNTVSGIDVPGGWSWEEYKQIKQELSIIRKSNWAEDVRDDFILAAYGLLNLLTTAFFTLDRLEYAVEEKILNSTVISPRKRISDLWEMAEKAEMMQERCIYIVDAIEEKYKELLMYSPKQERLYGYLEQHKDNKIALVVPKAYYTDIFYMDDKINRGGNVVCVTANRFDSDMEYDAVLVVGDIVGKKFDPLQCRSVQTVDVMLYECEGKTFNYRKRKQGKFERKLNEKMDKKQGKTVDLPPINIETDEEVADEGFVREFTDLSNYIESIGAFDIRRLTVDSASSDVNVTISEVKYIGKFVTGEQILFSKYYTAVVFNHEVGTVTEISVEKLVPGDIMVFTKRDDYTKNIVDDIYEKLIKLRKLSSEIIDASEKAYYWKEALREHKEKGGLTYRAISKQLRSVGCTLQEVTIRQWLVEDSHIVGPRNVKTMEAIAKITGDSYLLADAEGYFEACRIVRHERRSILELIEKAINDKLSGHIPYEDSILKVVYDNVDNLSERYELDQVSELENSVNVNINLVNRPITEAEVLL